MNHIHRLQKELETARNELRAKDEMLRAFQVHLTSPKFQGYDSDGERMDWIATSDVLAWIRGIIGAEKPSDHQEASTRALAL